MESDVPVVRLEGVTKRFGRSEALREVSLRLAPGHIVGLLGPNGAGKTTLIRTISGVLVPSSGSSFTFEVPSHRLSDEARQELGIAEQEARLIPWISVGEFLGFVSAFYPRWDREYQAELEKRFELDMRQKISKLSPGNRQRLAIVAALCHRPKLVLLDEPAAGLDPSARREFTDLLLDVIQETECTVVLSSHILSDVEKVADHVWLMRNGELRCDLPLDLLRQKYQRLRVELSDGVELDRQTTVKLHEYKRDARQAVVSLESSDRERFISEIAGHGTVVDEAPIPLEDIYQLEAGR
jgi:ABC-2 type transport system ATP-binding protein